jgi:hypothetical protein
MAYMSQEHKQQIHTALKQIIPAGWKWSLAVRNHSTICLNIASAPVNLLGEMNEARIARNNPPQSFPTHASVNPYYVTEQFTRSADLMKRIIAAMNAGNWDRSDIQTDYFDVGHYVAINIGMWNKPFQCTERLAA